MVKITLRKIGAVIFAIGCFVNAFWFYHYKNLNSDALVRFQNIDLLGSGFVGFGFWWMIDENVGNRFRSALVLQIMGFAFTTCSEIIFFALPAYFWLVALPIGLSGVATYFVYFFKWTAQETTSNS